VAAGAVVDTTPHSSMSAEVPPATLPGTPQVHTQIKELMSFAVTKGPSLKGANSCIVQRTLSRSGLQAAMLSSSAVFNNACVTHAELLHW